MSLTQHFLPTVKERIERLTPLTEFGVGFTGNQVRGCTTTECQRPDYSAGQGAPPLDES